MEVAFRRNHVGPLWERAGEGERQEPEAEESTAEKDLKMPGVVPLALELNALPVSKLNQAGSGAECSRSQRRDHAAERRRFNLGVRPMPQSGSLRLFSGEHSGQPAPDRASLKGRSLPRISVPPCWLCFR